MRLTRFVILSCAALLTAGTTLSSASDATALEIRHKHFDPSRQELSYELFNDSSRTMTAWRLSLARGDSHGHGNGSLLDQDFFEQAARAGSDGERGPLAPGASRVERWRLDVGSEDRGTIALSLRVVAVVFDDLDWQGEPEAAATILESRAHRVREIGRLVAALERGDGASRSRQTWSRELGERAERLRGESAQPGADGHLPREVAAQLSATRQELADWLDRAGRELLVAADPAASLRQMRQELERRYQSGLTALPSEVAVTLSRAHGKGGHQ